MRLRWARAETFYHSSVPERALQHTVQHDITILYTRRIHYNI